MKKTKTKALKMTKTQAIKKAKDELKLIENLYGSSLNALQDYGHRFALVVEVDCGPGSRIEIGSWHSSALTKKEAKRLLKNGIELLGKD